MARTPRRSSKRRMSKRSPRKSSRKTSRRRTSKKASRRMSKIRKSGMCSGLRKRVCQSSPNCKFVKSRGCRRRAGVKGGMLYQGPSLPEDY